MILTARRSVLPLRRPLRFAWGEIERREIVAVELTAGDGLVGRGEAAPLEGYDGVATGSVVAALDVFGRVLAACGPGADHRECLDRCRAERDLPQALAAVDLALWDLEAQRAGVPVSRLLHPGAAASVPVNAVVAATDRAGAAAEAAAAVAEGFGCLKVKVGTGDDAGRLAAVRAAVGSSVVLRADANGAWPSVDVALAALESLAPCGLELCEEPVHGEESLRELAEVSPVPVAADETWAPGVHAVALKVSRSGGITGLLADAAQARAAGSAVYVTSTYDGALGVAAGLHAAAALAADGPVLHSGLATLGAFEGMASGAKGGVIAVPGGPGLG